jgi:predicted dehydrogenase
MPSSDQVVKKGMSKTVHRVLVIGAGSIGERHVRCMLGTGRAAVGVVETQPETRATVTERYALSESFASLDDALKAPWHAAAIATPAPSHIPIAARLANLGLHLLVEKPLSLSTQGVAELIATVARKGIVANVGYVNRAQPALAAMRREFLSGRFGRPLELVAVYGQPFPLYRPAYRQVYFADRARGGGAIQDAITHVFNAGEWLLGPITRVCADAAHRGLEGVSVEDTVHVLARHDGVPASYSLNMYQAPNESTITVVCERGTVRYELHAFRWRWMTEPAGEWHDETFPLKDRDAWFTLQENAFLDAVEGQAPPLCTLAEGLQTLRVNLAVLESADNASGWIRVESP